MRYAIMVEDKQGNIIIVSMPPKMLYAKVQDTRDELEDLGYDTRGVTDIITLTEARQRVKRTSQ